jgi:DNA-binding transcriptional LysR family regulator
LTGHFDWNDLRHFLAVYRGGTLAAAARELKVQHTTVGRRLDALEDRLGASLFLRTPDGYVLTEAGSAILPLAERIEQTVVSLEQRVTGADERLEGLVRLTTSEAFSGFLVQRLTDLQARHPGLLVEVLAGNKTLDLARGEADLAIRLAATGQPDLIQKSLGEVGWSLYASQLYVQRAGIPKSSADLRGHAVIAFDQSMAGIPGAIWLEEHATGANVVLRGNSILSVLNAIVAGMGISVIPCFLGDADPTLQRLTPEVLGSRPLWLVFSPDRARLARVRAVIDFVTQMIGREMPRLRGRRPHLVKSA